GAGGGVLTLLRVFTQWLRQVPSLQPSVAYGPLHHDDELNVGGRRLLRGEFRPGRRSESWEGLPAHCVGRMFPGVESLQARGNRALWRELLDRHRLHQAICGYALTALPQALCGKRFVAWVATAMAGDKRA